MIYYTVGNGWKYRNFHIPPRPFWALYKKGRVIATFRIKEKAIEYKPNEMHP